MFGDLRSAVAERAFHQICYVIGCIALYRPEELTRALDYLKRNVTGRERDILEWVSIGSPILAQRIGIDETFPDEVPLFLASWGVAVNAGLKRAPLLASVWGQGGYKTKRGGGWLNSTSRYATDNPWAMEISTGYRPTSYSGLYQRIEFPEVRRLPTFEQGEGKKIWAPVVEAHQNWEERVQ